MSIIKSARLQAESEKNATIGRTHTFGSNKSKGPQYEDGELVWIGEYTDNREARPHKLVRGDKVLMTPQEQKLFVRTVYERGFAEYHYEGSIRLKESGPNAKHEDPKDPRRGLREGNGVLKYPLGEAFEGEWKNGKREGEGTLRTPQNYRYVGHWEDDGISGAGYEMLPSGCSYHGNFSNGVPHGQGNFFFTTGAEHDYHYEGPFVNGLRHGEGFIVYPNGDTFKGTWDQGRRQGKGITTRTIGSRTVQYQTEWVDDVLKGEPRVLDRMKRTKVPKTTAALTNQAAVMPADLTKWTVKEDVEDLPLEHFLRIKLGFEKLDESCGGSLSMGELTAAWGKGSQAMLRKLDTDGNGTVELDEIFAAWYPRVPGYSIVRYLSQDIHPRTLLRFRGVLGLRVHDHKQGFMQIVGVDSVEGVEDRPLTQRQLETNSYKIGGEKFSLAMYESAKNLCDPPHFAEILEVCYPNIPRLTLARYEMSTIPIDELDDLKEGFMILSQGESTLKIDKFEGAQLKFQERMAAKLKAIKDNEAPVDEDEYWNEDRLENYASEGFFKWEPFWPIGSANVINLSVPLLKDVDGFGTKDGTVSLSQLVRFCYPNVPCKRTAEVLSGKRTNMAVKCDCCICIVLDATESPL